MSLVGGPRRAGARPSDRGAGSVAVIGLVGLVLACAAALASIGGRSIAVHRAASAADAAALAAADARVGIAVGAPCELAARVAEAGGGALVACSLDGFEVTIRVAVAAPFGPALATATAGPPPGPAASGSRPGTRRAAPQGPTDSGALGIHV